MTTAASLLLSVSRPSVLEGCHLPEDSMCSLYDSWPASDLKEESGLRDNGELHDSSVATTTGVLMSVKKGSVMLPGSKIAENLTWHIG